jgi:hypothetical protein
LRRGKAILAFAVVLGLTTAASASQVTFTTPGGSTDAAGDPVAASAQFTTSADTVTIVLTNLLVNQKDVGQNVSDLFFTLSTSQSSGSISSSSATARDVASDGTFTDSGPVDTGWALTFDAATGFHLNGLAGATFVPAHTLLGEPDGSNVYSNANASIAGNGPHNPFLAGPATFIVSVAGVTADTVITSATFSFGTTAGDNVPGGGPGPPVPEPATVITALCGLAPLALVRLYRRRRSA